MSQITTSCNTNPLVVEVGDALPCSQQLGINGVAINNYASNSVASPWLHIFSPSVKPCLRLYCFPYAGGTGNVFTEWQQILGDQIEVCAICLPGRWHRVGENSINCMNTLSWEIATAIQAEGPMPFAFFGHSMGALLAYEVGQQLRKQGMMSADYFFMSAAQPPHNITKSDQTIRKKARDMSKNDLFAYLQTLSGTPKELLDDPQMFEHVLMSILPDLDAIDNWVYQRAKPLKQGISVFVGKEDKLIDLKSAQQWQQHTLAHCEIHQIPGDHFFIKQHREQVIAKIKRTLELENLI